MWIRARKNELALIVGAVTAAISLAIAFGAPVTNEQKEAIIAFTMALVPIVLAIRSQVGSVATVEDKYQVKPGKEPAAMIGSGRSSRAASTPGGRNGAM